MYWYRFMSCLLVVWYVFFFFQAEDGIRDLTVTGVQTCALPISLGRVSIEPFPGVIVSGFYHNERERNGIEGFNPQRVLGNVEVYDPQADRFKVNAQAVWADDGADVGKTFGPPIKVPGTYNGTSP